MKAFRCFEHMGKIQDVHDVPGDAQRALGRWNRVLAGSLTGKVSYRYVRKIRVQWRQGF